MVIGLGKPAPKAQEWFVSPGGVSRTSTQKWEINHIYLTTRLTQTRKKLINSFKFIQATIFGVMVWKCPSSHETKGLEQAPNFSNFGLQEEGSTLSSWKQSMRNHARGSVNLCPRTPKHGLDGWSNFYKLLNCSGEVSMKALNSQLISRSSKATKARVAKSIPV